MTHEGAVCQAFQLITAMQQAIKDDEKKMANPRKRKGGEASWNSAAHFLSALTNDASWNGKELADLYWKNYSV